MARLADLQAKSLVSEVRRYPYLDFAFVFNGAVFYSGRAVHNFVARFNFRVAQYLAKNGWFKFAKWFASQLVNVAGNDGELFGIATQNRGMTT